MFFLTKIVQNYFMQNDVSTKQSMGLLRRFGAIFYDALLLFATLFFASLPIAVPLNITTEHPWYPYFVIYIHIISFLFFGWFWTHGGQTLGLKTWKARLISTSGNSVTWKQALLRYIASLFCWLSLGIGFLWCFTNRERLAWNDILSKTRLIRIN